MDVIKPVNAGMIKLGEKYVLAAPAIYAMNAGGFQDTKPSKLRL